MLIATTNFVDSGTIPDHTTEQDSTYFSAENLQSIQLGKSYIANSSSAAFVEFDFLQSRVIDVVAILKHNLNQTTGTVRIRIGNDDTFASTEYDSGVVAAWPTVEEFGYLAYGEFHWGGILTAEAALDYPISYYDVLDQAVQARYMRIDLANGNDLIEVGRVFAGPSYRPTNEMGYGWEISWVDPSRITRSRSGQTFVDILPRYRVISFELNGLPGAEIFHNVFNHMDRRKGISEDVLVIPQETDETTFITQNIYGRQAELNPVENRVLDHYARRIEVEEII